MKDGDSNQRSDTAGSAVVRVWDVPTRIFHWALVVLVGVSLYTGLTGGFAEMEWHVKCGFAVLALVIFRLVWGVAGSARSRFADFVRGPRAALAYARGLLSPGHPAFVGHNPLGGWSVLALLTSLAVQAGTGLFSNDDILTEGPLAKLVSRQTSALLSEIHEVNANILMVLIGVHLAAITFYAVAKREDLVRPMVTGVKRLTSADADRPFVPAWRGAVVLAAAAALVWGIVSL